MTNNKERDARRIRAEARALLEERPAVYVPSRMIGDELDEPEPFEPAPARRPRLDTRQPQPEPDWSAWETWLETRLNAALAIQREEIAEIIAEVIAGEREAAAEAWRDQVRGLRADLDKTAQLLEQLGKIIDFEGAERAKVVMDLPQLPRRGDLN